MRSSRKEANEISRFLGSAILACALFWLGAGRAVLAAPAQASVSPLARELVIREWTAESGLPQNTINAIVQGRDGYLWLGTREGLVRFDGVRFRVFGLRDGLNSVEVQTLYEDPLGQLWIGTAGGGVNMLHEGRIERLPLPPGAPSSGVVRAFAEDDQRRLLVGTRGGLLVWKNGAWLHDPVLEPLAKAAVQTLLADHHGQVWIATSALGLFEFHEGILAEVKGPPEQERIAAYCLLHDEADGLWASIGNGYLLRKHAEWTVYDRSDGVPYAYVTTLAQELGGSVWAGSLDDGLYYLQNGHFYPIRAEHGLSGNDIRSLRADREGNLWVGTRTAGLNRLARRRLNSFGRAQGLTNDFTRSVAESADGTMWVGTTGGGLYRGSNGWFEPFVPEPVVAVCSFVETVLVTRDGAVWWGASAGLFRSEDGRLTGAYTNEPWIKTSVVTTLCDDEDGGVWVGTSESRLLQKKDGGFLEVTNEVALGSVTALVKDGKNLWVGSMAGGLRKLSPDGSVTIITNGLLSSSVRALYLDDDRTLWIGTAGGGLAMLRDLQDGQATSFTSAQGLGSDTVSQILEDSAGNLWLGTSQGLLRIHKSELKRFNSREASLLHPWVFGVIDGMPALECSSGSGPAAVKLRSGMLCFSTVKGLVVVDPKLQEAEGVLPSVVIEEISARGADNSGDPSSRVSVSAIASEQGGARDLRAVLPVGGREVEVNYTAIYLRAPEQLSFRYRLNPLDRDWVEAARRRTAYYTHIPAGRFVFEVSAREAGGSWSEPAAMTIVVPPRLWETAWFRAALALVAIGSLAAGIWLAAQRKHRHQLAALQTQHAIEEERRRIAQDMHDQVGGILTQVSLLSTLGQQEAEGKEAASYLERISLQVRAAIQSVDEIIWATNPRSDNLARFAEYVSRFADECLESANIRCWQEVPPDLPSLPLRAETRHNVFLAVREAFNNVLKHSAAKEVWLRIACGNSVVTVEIEDNGKGFRLDERAPRGNGLENMRSRLRECGGRVELQSGPGQGTKIKFIFDLAEPSEALAGEKTP